MRHKKRLFFFAGLFLFLSLFFFRYTVIAGAFELALQRATGDKLTYENRYWEEGKLIYEGVYFNHSFYAEKAVFNFSVHNAPLYFETHVELKKPKIYVHRENSVLFSPLLFSKWWTVKLDIDQGEIELEGSSIALSFDFKSGATKDEIGSLVLFGDERLQEPFFYSEFIKANNRLVIEWSVAKTEVKRLLEVVYFLCEYPKLKWEGLSGNAAMHGKSEFDLDFCLIKTAADIELQSVAALNPQIGLHVQAENFKAHVEYPVGNPASPIWEQIIASASIEQGSLFFEDILGLAHCHLFLVLDPHEEPHLEIEGKIAHHDKNYPLSLHAKGAVHDDASFWIEGGLKIVTREEEPSEMTFSFCSPFLDSYVAQVDIHHMDNASLEIALEGASLHFPEVKDFILPHGQLQGCITGWIEKGEFKRLQWSHVRLKDLYLEEADSTFLAFLNGATSSGEMKKTDVWNIADLNLEVKEGAFSYKKWRISELDASITIAQDVFEHSFLKGAFMDICGEVRLSGIWRKLQASSCFSAPLSQWLCSPYKEKNDPMVHLFATSKKHEEGYTLTGSFISEKEEVQFGAAFDICAAFRQGWFKSDLISSTNYLPIIHYFDPDLQVEGSFSLSGTAAADQIKGHFVADNFYLGSAKGGLKLASPTEADIVYDIQKGEWSGKIPIKGGILQENGHGLILDHIEAECVLADYRLRVEHGLAQCEGIDICARGDLIFTGAQESELRIATESIRGSVENLVKLSSRFLDSFDFPHFSDGTFISKENGFHFFLSQQKDKTEIDWRLKAKFQDVAFKVSDKAKLEKIQFDFDFDSSAPIAVLSNLEANAALGTNKYRLSAPSIQYRNHTCEFELNFNDEKKEVFKLIGIGKEVSPQKFYVSCEHENNHFYSSRWDKLSFNLEKKEITQMEFSPRFQGKDLYEGAVFLSDIGLFSLESPHFELLKKIEGEITAKLTLSSSNHFIFEAKSPALLFDETQVGGVELEGKKIGDEWSFTKLSLGNLCFQGKIFQGEVPYWEMQWKNIVVKGEGSIHENITCQIKCIEGLFPSSYRIQSSEMTFSLSPYLSLQGIDLTLFEHEKEVWKIWTGALKYNVESKKWEGEKIGFKAALFKDKEKISGFLNIKWTPAFFSFQGVVEEGKLFFEEIAIQPSQFMGFYEAPYLNFKCHARLTNAPVYIQARLNPSKGFEGTVTLQDKGKKEGVVLSLKNPFFCESIVGSLYGLELYLQRKDSTHPFSGKVGIKDGSLASHLFPESFSLIKEIKNLELIGSWGSSDLVFQGEVRGKEVEFKNYCFQEVHAALRFTLDQASFKNFTLADNAGTLSIKQVECIKKSHWSLDIPFVKVCNFKPSLVRKVGVEVGREKPFLIRNLLLSDVHAEIDRGLSLSGMGRFNFTNSLKKEDDFFEIPATMLKNLGLSLEIFTPVSGEVECLLKDKKIFFTNFQNTFSEGRRSQFYLAPDLESSFIDLEGNLSINMRMKQDVILKLAEPFALTIRGTLEKPRYGLE